MAKQGRKTSDVDVARLQGIFTGEQFEFVQAIEADKKKRKRSFLSLTEIFEVVKSLGYHK